MSICSSGGVLYSAGYSVKRVYVVLSGLIMRVCVSPCMYFMLMSLCIDVMVMSSV